MANDNNYTNSAKLYYPSDRYRQQSHISSLDEYKRLYNLSIENPVKFWRDIALENFFWKELPSEKNFLNYNFDPTNGAIFVEWMRGAKTNICYNAVDRQIELGHGDKIAYIWEGNAPGEEKKITYNELKSEVSKFANVLRSYGVQKGSRVAIYMPVTIELVVAMLGCARIGAVHTVVFAGFSAEALADRMIDAKCAVLVTADGYYRGNKLIQLKEISAEALERCNERGHRIPTCIVHRRINLPVIVTGNGSIVNSHLPNGQPLIRRQAVAAAAAAAVAASGTSPLNVLNAASNNRCNNIHNINNNSINNNNNNNHLTSSNLTSISSPVQNAVKQRIQLQPQIPMKAISWNYSIDVWWDTVMDEASEECEPVWVDAEDPLFILYTRPYVTCRNCRSCCSRACCVPIVLQRQKAAINPGNNSSRSPQFLRGTNSTSSTGSTGKPKGVVHTTGGYMIYAATTFKYVFNYRGDDVFFCTADLGWITGHTVNVYGSLCNGTTITLFEGTPFHPDPGRLWQIVERHQVNTFYTAPTAIRSLMKFSESHVTNYDRSSLKLLGTAGEPINPEAWNWYFDVVGNGQCPIVDTFWQTETSAPMLTPLPGATPLKPGSATFPFFGVEPAVVDENGKELDGPAVGHLVFKSPWPGMMRTIDNDHARFEITYFSTFPGYYATGDHVKRDKDGYYWVLGRADDMLNVSGHLLSTAEVESALAEHRAVAEAAAVSFPHEIKGQALFCYVVLKEDFVFNENIEQELRFIVRHKIGPLASPDIIKCLKQLPKTRSGKTMRRILRKASLNDYNLGDISTIADPSALFELFPTGYNGSCDRRIEVES